MNPHTIKTIATFFVSSLLLLFACRKESFITSPDASVFITADTVRYDTVFTATGSITQSFKIINENNQKLRLSSVKLMGGSSSAYKINVDGISTTEATNIEIEANDSVYVFVQVNVNPNSNNLPFVIRDSIQISYNGKNRLVQLEAWGQNAHFFRNKEIITTEIWTNDLPYVIQGYLRVNTNQTLTIEKGCRIYLHADAPIVVNGTLKVNGEKDSINRVYFQGDRLDDPYKDYPAAWPGIYFGPISIDNVLNYAVIKNSYQSIATEDPSTNANPKLILNECVIDNSYDAGITAENSSITARNCLISNCGKNIILSKGGNYQFTHCTVVSYSNNFINHKDPVLSLADNINAVFRNCIFWGENGLTENEVVTSNTIAANVFFDHPLWKVQTTPANVTVLSAITGAPQFDTIDVSKRIYNFRLRDTSPAVNAGVSSIVSTDLDGAVRPVGLPDIGCYERQ
jgi:hypothetical protein